MSLLLAPLALALLQAPPPEPSVQIPPPAPAQLPTELPPQGSAQVPNQAPVQVPAVLYPSGIEAPDQPFGQSSSSVARLPRRAGAPSLRTESGSVRVRVGDLSAVRGQEDNVVHGIGLVIGLAGTGDAAGAAKQAILNLLLTQNITLDAQAVTSANVAVVWVEATLPPGIKPGRQIDCRVSSLYDAKSLVGGTLVRTELTDPTGADVFATASGSITTGAFSVGGQSASAVRNFTTVGTVPLGCKVEREVPAPLVSENGSVYLDARANKGSFGNAVRIADAVNALYAGAAEPQDAMTVAVRIPGDLPSAQHVAYLGSILALEIEPERLARVVVNERTGVIVMGDAVRITRGAITKGNLTVTIAETPEASQPGALSEGETVELPRTSLLIEEEDSPLSIVSGAVDLQEVVEVLNVLGVTPRDMIQILHSMSQSGMLHAEVVVQ